MAMPARDVFIKKLRYQSWHRGCKETDILLGPFADAWLEKLSDDELVLFEGVLDEDDADLWNWLCGKQEVPERLRHKVMERIMAFVNKAA